MNNNNDNTILTPKEFSQVLNLESEGNGSFAASEWSKAEESYTKAIAIFESKICVTYAGDERTTLVQLLANLSRVFVRKGSFIDAEAFASKCLYLRPGHEQASYQRAKARLEISRSKPTGDATRIGWAIEDVKSCQDGSDKTQLEEQLQHEASRIEKYEQKQLFMGFGSYATIGGDHSNESTTMVGETADCRTNEVGYVN